MSSLVKQIKDAKKNYCPHPLPKIQIMTVTPVYAIREDELDELILNIDIAQKEGILKGLEEAASYPWSSIYGPTLGENISRAIHKLKRRNN